MAGDANLCAAFEAARRRILCTAVRRDTLRNDVLEMRLRMQRELEGRGGQFDIKQDAGGIADIEFLVQYWVLAAAQAHQTSDLLGQHPAARRFGGGRVLAAATAQWLTEAYIGYRTVLHHLLARGSGERVVEAAPYTATRARVIEIWRDTLRGSDGNDSGECAASVHRDRGGLAAVLPDAGHVPVEFASQGVSSRSKPAAGPVPLLRRRVPVESCCLAPALVVAVGLSSMMLEPSVVLMRRLMAARSVVLDVDRARQADEFRIEGLGTFLVADVVLDHPLRSLTASRAAMSAAMSILRRPRRSRFLRASAVPTHVGDLGRVARMRCDLMRRMVTLSSSSPGDGDFDFVHENMLPHQRVRAWR